MKTILDIRTALICTICILILLVASDTSTAQLRARSEIRIPDIPGYLTLKCDLHMHTVFSDGNVWPTVRVDEAWREGLDAFAITEHVEYLPHSMDIKKDHNRSYSIAHARAKVLGMLQIHGAEITRSMPPGHFNAIFLEDVNPLEQKEYLDAFEGAINQGAFIFWNHPGWRQPEGKPIWYEEHTELHEKGWLHGIEVVNGNSYYPFAHKWSLDKKLTMIGTSDVHRPIGVEYDFSKGEHRPVTLVFAKERSVESIKEALFDRRTAVYWKNNLIGEERFLKPIFSNSYEIVNRQVQIKGSGPVYLQIKNHSDVTYELELVSAPENIAFPETINLYANKTVLVRLVISKLEAVKGKQEISALYTVKNLLTAPEQGLKVELVIPVVLIQ